MIGPPVAAADSPGAAYAVGVQQRRLGTALAPVGSPAMLYGEWVRLITGGEPGSGRVRHLADDGFLVDVDEQVALRDVRLDSARRVIDLRECRAGRPCYFISDRLLRGEDCVPAPGCPTVDSDTGDVRAVQVATLLHREPAQNVLYRLRTERPISSITEPTGTVLWDHSPYFLLHFPDLPAEDTTLVLTIRYEDGGTDRMTMRFRAPIEAQAPSGATTTAP